jgi:DNA polymerase-3 subunit epsilon
LHGALLDAEILADLYLVMTSGQRDLLLREEDAEGDGSEAQRVRSTRVRPQLEVLRA